MGKRNIFIPGSSEQFKLSRSKLELFIECPRCFYLDQRCGIKRPSGPAFTLNSAVDTLLKKEFDLYRVRGETHPLLKKHGLDMIPANHDDLEKWRHNFTGIQHLHKKTGILVYGSIDDLWINTKKEYVVVDYKATSKAGEILSLDDTSWKEGYQRQMEVYQWLLKQNGHKVSKTGYFVYCNGLKDRERFDGNLEFAITLIPYKGDDGWVNESVCEVHECLSANKIPEAGEDCEFCAYTNKVSGMI